MKNVNLGICALFLLFAQAAPVSANTVCSAGMIRNTYGYVGSTIVQGPEGLMYCGVTGVFTFRLDGTAQGALKQSCGGMLESVKGTATYEVRPNCTATANVVFSDGDSATWHFTIVDGGKKLFFVGEQPGVTFTGTGEQL